LRLEAVATVHGPVVSWLERNLRLVPTVCTGCRIHLTWFALAKTTVTITTRLLAGSTAFWASARIIGQSTARIKFLFANRKREFLITIATIQGSIN
jgi:hypothetical protein